MFYKMQQYKKWAGDKSAITHIRETILSELVRHSFILRSYDLGECFSFPGRSFRYNALPCVVSLIPVVARIRKTAPSKLHGCSCILSGRDCGECLRFLDALV